MALLTAGAKSAACGEVLAITPSGKLLGTIIAAEVKALDRSTKEGKKRMTGFACTGKLVFCRCWSPMDEDEAV